MKMAKHYWSSHIAAVQAQAITTRAYAKRHGLALSTLYYWQRKLRSATTDCANSEGVAASRHPSKFVALTGMALTLAVLAFSGRRKCLNLKAKGGG